MLIATPATHYINFDTVATARIRGMHLANLAKQSTGATNTYWDVTGSATPEAALIGSVGSSYRDIGGGANTTLYIKEVGDDANNWAAM